MGVQAYSIYDVVNFLRTFEKRLRYLDNLLENALSAAGFLRVDGVNRLVWNICTNIVGFGNFLPVHPDDGEI